MEPDTCFKISFEHVGTGDDFHTFRVAFHDCTSRILLPYPHLTGIRVLSDDDSEIEAWHTRYLVSSPMDDFVLIPKSRIAFDLHAHVRCATTREYLWTIELPRGVCRVRYTYHVDNNREWYDFLAKKSRFAALTTPWNGLVQSNTVQINNTIG